MFSQWEVIPTVLPTHLPDTVRKVTEKITCSFQINRLPEKLDMRDLYPAIPLLPHTLEDLVVILSHIICGRTLRDEERWVKHTLERIKYFQRNWVPGSEREGCSPNPHEYFFCIKIHIFHILKIMRYITYVYEWSSSVCILWLALVIIHANASSYNSFIFTAVYYSSMCLNHNLFHSCDFFYYLFTITWNGIAK